MPAHDVWARQHEVIERLDVCNIDVLGEAHLVARGGLLSLLAVEDVVREADGDDATIYDKAVGHLNSR